MYRVQKLAYLEYCSVTYVILRVSDRHCKTFSRPFFVSSDFLLIRESGNAEKTARISPRVAALCFSEKFEREAGAVGEHGERRREAGRKQNTSSAIASRVFLWGLT